MESIKKVWAKMKEHKKASIIGAAVIVVLLIVIAVNNSSDGFYTIDVAQNYKLECSGENGDATANVSIATDKDDLVESILFKLYPNSSNDFVKEGIYSSFLSGLDFTYNKKDHISNGDEITATANYDKNQAKELKLKLTDTTLKTKAAYLSSYVHKDTNISETLQKNIDQKATETIKKFLDAGLSDAWSAMGGATAFEKNEIQLVDEPKIQSKYKLCYKDDQSSNRCQFAYIYELNLTGPTKTNVLGETTQTGQLTGYMITTLSNIEIEGDNVLNCDTPMYTSYSNYNITFKSVDDAKEKVLDTEKIKEFNIIAL